MSPVAKISAFGAALLAIFGVGAAVGSVAGPAPAATHSEAKMSQGEGVVSADAGYRLVSKSSVLAGGGGTFRFVIEGPQGRAVTRFVSTHTKRLHLVLVSRDLTSYQHVHPMLAPDGTWSVDLPALPAGSYRAVADFQVADGPALALGIDVGVAGRYEPAAPASPSHVAEVDDYGIGLTAHHGSGAEVEFGLTVRRAGTVVADLQPYLGATGHLVAMRAGDLHYAHVHPLGVSDGTVRFSATLPSAGRYRLFFDFKHAGKVRTAAFSFDQGQVTDAPAMGH